MPVSNCVACRLTFTLVSLLVVTMLKNVYTWYTNSLVVANYVGFAISLLTIIVGFIALRRRHIRLLNFYAVVQTVFLVGTLVSFIIFVAEPYFQKNGVHFDFSFKNLDVADIVRIVSCLFLVILKIRSIFLARCLAKQLAQEASEDIELAPVSEQQPAQPEQQVVIPQVFQQSYLPVSQDNNIQLVPIYVDQFGNPVVQVHQ